MKTTLSIRLYEDDHDKLQSLASDGHRMSEIVSSKIAEYLDRGTFPETRRIKTRTTTLSFDVALAARLKEMCDRLGVSPNVVVESAVREIINREAKI